VLGALVIPLRSAASLHVTASKDWTGACWQPLPATHWSVVHASPSLHVASVQGQPLPLAGSAGH
jgi:hypothetical protein